MSPKTQEIPEALKCMLVRTPVIQEACAFDLLVFFYRHPRAILTSEQLSIFIGYDLNRIGTSLDALIHAKLLIRAKNSTHSARIYTLRLEGPQEQELTELLQFASTPNGRRRMLQHLKTGQKEPGDHPSTVPGGSITGEPMTGKSWRN